MSSAATDFGNNYAVLSVPMVVWVVAILVMLVFILLKTFGYMGGVKVSTVSGFGNLNVGNPTALWNTEVDKWGGSIPGKAPYEGYRTAPAFSGKKSRFEQPQFWEPVNAELYGNQQTAAAVTTDGADTAWGTTDTTSSFVGSRVKSGFTSDNKLTAALHGM